MKNILTTLEFNMNATNNTTTNPTNTTQENNMITLENIELLAATISTPADKAIEAASLSPMQEMVLGGSLRSFLTNNYGFTNKQALVASAAYIASFPNLCGGSDDLWVECLVASADEGVLVVDGVKEAVSGQPILEALVAGGFIIETEENENGGQHDFGQATIDSLNQDKQLLSPVKKEDFTRVMNYGRVKGSNLSPLVIKAIDILESTESVVSQEMLTIANLVFEGVERYDEKYVIEGCNALESGVPYVTEFMADKRFRLYQAACHGYNGQSSDMARSLQDLANVSTNYDVAETMVLLKEEIADMHSLNKADFRVVYKLIKSDAVTFIKDCLTEKHPLVKKPWNLVKFCLIMQDLHEGNKPYIGVAVGYDAKCSGPQLGALMTNSQGMLKATGFDGINFDAEGNITNEDAYHNAINSCDENGIPTMGRNDIKKPFMSIFYGAGSAAMREEATIEAAAFDALYTDFTGEKGKRVATETPYNIALSKRFHGAVTKSFGYELAKLRSSICGAAEIYVKDGDNIQLLNSKIIHEMPDGAKVEMDYKIVHDINGDLVTKKGQHVPSVQTLVEGNMSRSTKPTFRTNEDNLPRFAQTGFVNMIQATDALLARLIVVHCHNLGIEGIVAIHDCFRVSIHDTAKLKQAIANAYRELFGNNKNVPTNNLPCNLDIIAEYWKGVKLAAINPEKVETTSTQFNSRGIRGCRKVGSKSISALINNLGETEGKSYYFAK